LPNSLVVNVLEDVQGDIRPLQLSLSITLAANKHSFEALSGQVVVASSTVHLVVTPITAVQVTVGVVETAFSMPLFPVLLPPFPHSTLLRCVISVLE
jgi:hypothetical protein